MSRLECIWKTNMSTHTRDERYIQVINDNIFQHQEVQQRGIEATLMVVPTGGWWSMAITIYKNYM